MDVGILGTGVVGRTLAGAIARAGERVVIGTRDVAATLERTDTGPMGTESFAAWSAAHPAVEVATLAGAAARAELVINATSGLVSLDALAAAGADNLGGKILIDVANPLDFSSGFPPTFSVYGDDSLAEQIQRAFPAARVVKTLNTVNAALMVDPTAIGGGEHHLFVSGDDAQAKAEVVGLLGTWFGWRHVLDLGDITTARGPEMYLALWVRVRGAVGSNTFNVRVVV